ncbi:hypothetical protein ACFQX9_38005 [Bradyrhizobium sp. GCM10028915]|uniref:hypothetical protein n=1 Tax=Bradyrhizobium sp. GCM10028915 TaxID=3273385 RepID=UPI00362209CC
MAVPVCILLQRRSVLDCWRNPPPSVVIVYYPITQSQTILFTPAWLIVLAYCRGWLHPEKRWFFPRGADIDWRHLALFAGQQGGRAQIEDVYFFTVNVRMSAVRLAMDVCNEFFSKHELIISVQLGS